MAFNELAARADALDLMLFDVCDNLQLSPTQHQKAEDRYHAIAKVISAANSPFSRWDSNLYRPIAFCDLCESRRRVQVGAAHREIGASHLR